MKTICAWCSVELSKLGPDTEWEQEVSHGMCELCSEKLCMENPAKMKEFLDKLEAPVLVIDSDGVALSCNEMAMQALNKPLDEVSGERGGDVMNCVFAKEPEGCGNTVHCKACTIRRLVMTTHETGRSTSKVPAYLYSPEQDDIRKIKFLLSTELVNSVVLLRLDSANPDDLMHLGSAIEDMKLMFESSSN